MTCIHDFQSHSSYCNNDMSTGHNTQYVSSDLIQWWWELLAPIAWFSCALNYRWWKWDKYIIKPSQSLSCVIDMYSMSTASVDNDLSTSKQFSHERHRTDLCWGKFQFGVGACCWKCNSLILEPCLYGLVLCQRLWLPVVTMQAWT